MTADNVANLIRTQDKWTCRKQLAVAWAIASNKVNLTSGSRHDCQSGRVQAVAKEQMAQCLPALNLSSKTRQYSTTDSQPTLAYCGYDCLIKGEVQGFPVTAYLQRQGLIDWQVVDVELP